MTTDLPAITGLRCVSLQSEDIWYSDEIVAVLGWTASLPQLTRLELWSHRRGYGSPVTASVVQALDARVVEHTGNVLTLRQQG